jgi:16S rRNA (uracil1498-N3)-methyltransferase
MNLILLFETDFIDEKRVRIFGRRFEHVSAVLGSQEGDVLKVGLLNGKMGTGAVTARRDGAVELMVDLRDEPPAPLPVTLVVALPRPPTLKKVVEAGVSLGVKRLVFIQSSRVEKSYWQSPVLDEANLLQHVHRGLEQARDTVMPEIAFRRRFKPFVEDELPVLARGTRCLLAHPQGGPCPRCSQQALTVAIGPEGGFIPYEVDALSRIGFEKISLGPRILRVEYAVAAVLGRLMSCP